MRYVTPLRFAAVTVATALLFAGGCETSPSIVYTGSVTDPAGDATAAAGVTVSPDLVGAKIDISGTNLTITVTFGGTSLSPALTSWSAVLDTDENIATGFPGIDTLGNDATLLGVDYMITAVNAANSSQATIFKFTGSVATNVGTAVVTFPSATQSQVVVPLSLLGSDEGKMAFKVLVQQALSVGFTGILDFMPNIGFAPGLVR